MDITLGQWLKARREALGFTLRDVERILDGKLSNAAISQIETGHTANVSAKNLNLLCAAYALDFGEALSRAGDPTAPPPPTLCPACGRAM